MGIRTCRELLALEYGSELATRIQESDVAVGTSPVQLVSGNGARIWIAIGNNFPNAVYVSTLSTFSAYQGYAIPASSSQIFAWKRDGDFCTIALYAICSSPGQSVHVIEAILIG